MSASSGALALAFVACAAVSLASSAALIVRIERIGHRVGVTEAVLGLTAAVAADAPEITSAVTALVRGQHDVGLGVVLGANVFQLAALLGLGALAAGGITLDRRVVVLEGIPAVWVALMALAVVAGAPAAPSLVGALALFVPYVVVASLDPAARARLPLPAWLRLEVGTALDEEEDEIADVLDDVVDAVPPGRHDGPVAVAALVLVVTASIALEATATELGGRWGVSDVVLGGIVLAVVTSLPNVVAAIYLARRGRGAATLSEAMNSNRVNTLAGLLVPAAVIGIGATALGSATGTLALWYVGMTVGVLLLAYAGRGLGRPAGGLIVGTYALVVVTLLR